MAVTSCIDEQFIDVGLLPAGPPTLADLTADRAGRSEVSQFVRDQPVDRDQRAGLERPCTAKRHQARIAWAGSHEVNGPSDRWWTVWPHQLAWAVTALDASCAPVEPPRASSTVVRIRSRTRSAPPSSQRASRPSRSATAACQAAAQTSKGTSRGRAARRASAYASTSVPRWPESRSSRSSRTRRARAGAFPALV